MTPASSASYMWFSSILDCGLSAFLAFTAILCQVEYTSGQYDWTTLLGTEVAKHDIIFAGFIISTSLGGLHLISLVIAIWLAIIFRKIARLPPGQKSHTKLDYLTDIDADMNPLEDNLTARSHKRNKSEFTIEDKNMSQTSLTSSRGHGRSDSVDPLISPPRTVPFMHTRTGSSENVAMYRPNTGMHGRNGSSEDVSTYHQDNGSRHSPVGGIATNQPYQSSNASFQGSRTGLDHNAGGFYNQPSHVRTSRPDFNRPPSSGPSPNRPGSAQNRGIQHRPAKPSQLRADWTHPSSTPYSTTNDENVEPSWAQQEQTSYQPYHEAVDIRDWYSPSPGQKGRAQANKDYLPVPSHEPEKRKSKVYDFDRDVKTPVPQAQSPLGMHPPSPSVYSSSPNPSPPPPEHRRVALSDADVNLPDAMSTQRVANASPPRSGPQRPSSFVGSGTKTKYYGDVIHFSRVPTLSRDKSDLSGYSDRSEVDGGTDSASAYSTSEQGIPDANLDKKGRVISNSGYDLNSTYAGLDPEFGKGMASRRRDVSGKIAEEGRGNGSNNTGAPGAAGWARFKGL